MVLAYLTFFTGIAISLVAIYYSVIGLAAIFASAVMSIVIMGTTLEAAKLVTAWWLKANWHRAPLSIKIYLLPAVIMLMIITSMGIFGFLSKAHTDQTVPLGDTAAQVAFIDEKINNEREIIANSRSLIKQLDDAVMGIQSGQGRELRNSDGTTRVENPAERALQIRRAQAKDREALTKTIEQAQAKIVKLQEEKAPIAGQLRAVEAEVGPIKYIAKLIYGNNPDQNILEKAVVWVIIIIVLVFDPLAVLLLLASQMSFQWARQEREERKNELVQESIKEGRPPEESSTSSNDGNRTKQRDQTESTENLPIMEDIGRSQEAGSQITGEKQNDAFTDDHDDNAGGDNQRDNHGDDRSETILGSSVEKHPESNIEKDTLDDEILEDRPENLEKQAIHRWKDENPDSSIKRNRKLFEEGLITELPWQKYIDEYKALELIQIAQSYDTARIERIKPDLTEVIEPDSYVQNSEQNENTLWKRIQEKKHD